MGTIARTAKAGGGTNFNAGQTIDPAEVNTDFNTVYTEINALLDDANIETATIPGAKSLRFTEITAPANPSANDTLLYSVDRNSRTTVEYRDSAGNVMLLGGLLSVRCTHSVNQSIANSTDTALAFDTETWDTLAVHDTVTNNSRITPGIVGRYLVVGTVQWAINATGRRDVYVRLNGATSYGGTTLEGAAMDTTQAYQQAVAFVNMTATDYVELVVFQDSGGALNALATTTTAPSFQLFYMGN